jgi:hypothetical protein
LRSHFPELGRYASQSAFWSACFHRMLQRHGLSRPPGAASEAAEYRSYEAHYAGDIWYGDVMHGPRVPVQGRLRKVYSGRLQNKSRGIQCRWPDT